MVTLRCYDPSDDGNSGIYQWFNTLDPAARSAVFATLSTAQLASRVDRIPSIKPLRKHCVGIDELIVDFELDGEKRMVRIFGFEGPGRKEFTLLHGFEKTPENISYGNPCVVAKQRKEGVIHDTRKAPLYRPEAVISPREELPER